MSRTATHTTSTGQAVRKVRPASGVGNWIVEQVHPMSGRPTGERQVVSILELDRI